MDKNILFILAFRLNKLTRLNPEICDVFHSPRSPSCSAIVVGIGDGSSRKKEKNARKLIIIFFLHSGEKVNLNVGCVQPNNHTNDMGLSIYIRRN